jgi:membrane protein DedA with SNARE-associated domain
MTLDSLVETTVTFVRAHEKWAFPIVFALAFGESLAFVSLLLPATVILFGLGALIGEAELSFVPLWASAALGAAAGDWREIRTSASFYLAPVKAP